ncbi:FecR family protein [Bacteroides ovatus]|uniref:FecR family protein n=10 Tax=Bacteroides TaxID=816 RepID=A0A1G8P076_BACOV|nr:sigma-70 family RNA polymerase sigma factor [Bacteroides ovatus]SDI85819.1 FecR family protein [Bacteroides ovatus]
MNNSQNAITVIYREHWQKLYIHAYNLLNDEESAKDVVNDVFCSVLESNERLTTEEDLLPLFFVMVRNRCIDQIRHQNVVHKNAERYLEELYSGWTVKEYREYEDKINRMQESIRQMAPQMRTVVEEFFLNEKKCAEISEKLRISDNTVRTHIARALKILRKQLTIFFLKKSYRGVISFSNLYVFNETIDTMIDHSDKKLDYALRAIQHPQLRETDEFLQWIGIPENKELFLELMACKEAVIRENLQRKRKYRKKMRILAIASSVAAVLILAFLIPSLLPSTSLPAEQPIRFFAANNNDEHVVLQMDGRSEQQLLTDSVMDVKDWKTVSADTVCCQTLTTPRGKDFLLVLADGTKVWLNAESRLRYPVAFHGKERRVELEGEACFEVAKDAEHPFIVCANGMNTMVLGTKFNVRSYSVEDRHVTLVNGKVQVTNTVNNKSVTLRPGQDLTYTETGEEKVSEVNIATYTAWTEGMFYFEDVPLEEIMGALGRWYNVNIDFERCELYHIRLNFWANKNTHLDEALELLNKLEKVQVDYQDGTITIKQI